MGVVISMVWRLPVVGVAWCPGAVLAWLQRSQSPAALFSLVWPPIPWERMWSMCRMGASHQGVRQVWSRVMIIFRRFLGKVLAVESMAMSWPVPGVV